MKDPIWMMGDDVALDKADYEADEQAEYDDAESAWECANDR